MRKLQNKIVRFEKKAGEFSNLNFKKSSKLIKRIAKFKKKAIKTVSFKKKSEKLLYLNKKEKMSIKLKKCPGLRKYHKKSSNLRKCWENYLISIKKENSLKLNICKAKFEKIAEKTVWFKKKI